MDARGRVEHKIKGEGRSGNRDTEITKTDNKSSEKKTVSPVNDGHSKGNEWCNRSMCFERHVVQLGMKEEQGLEAATRRKKEKIHLLLFYVLNTCYNYECKHKITFKN